MESVNTTTFGEPLVSLLHHKSGPESVQGVGVGDIIEQSSPCSLQEELDLVSPEAPRHTIFRVHHVLRNTNNEAYEPRYISIGPYHSHNESLKEMKIHKLRYLKRLLGGQCISMQECVSAIERREPEARRCYAEPINLGPTEFCEMLVLDACFIIEFAKQSSEGSWSKGDPIITMPWMEFYITVDLILFENQIPLFVICELSNFIFGPQLQGELIKSLLRLFEDLYPVPVYSGDMDPTGIKHLLELIYKSFNITYEDQHVMDQASMDGNTYVDPGEIFIRSAAMLVESNVSFARTGANDSMFRIDFKDGCMRLPHLKIDDATEPFWRNLIAYEQYFSRFKECYFTYLAIVLDLLINTTEDVKLLMKCEIIQNCLGSDDHVANMFNKLTDNVILPPRYYFTYKWHLKDVRDHCSLQRNVWMAKLKRNHLNSPWAIISICAAILLLLLTFLQTLFTIKT